MNEDLAALEEFSGVTRLFPLPNLVLFPTVVQGLHIFEPRYRQMTADALAADRLICLVLLQPGWEADYDGRPAICEIACLGRIIRDERLEDGRYNLKLRGLRRARILQEIDDAKLYRQAQVELLEDVGLPGPDKEKSQRRHLLRQLPNWIAGQAADLLRTLLNSNLPLGAICDLFGYALPLAVNVKQDLLETVHVEKRAKKLIRYLRTANPASSSESAAADEERRFPPNFSSN